MTQIDFTSESTMQGYQPYAGKRAASENVAPLAERLKISAMVQKNIIAVEQTEEFKEGGYMGQKIPGSELVGYKCIDKLEYVSNISANYIEDSVTFKNGDTFVTVFGVFLAYDVSATVFDLVPECIFFTMQQFIECGPKITNGRKHVYINIEDLNSLINKEE